MSATVHYEVQILTTAGVRVDSGTGSLSFSQQNPDAGAGGLSASFSSSRPTRTTNVIDDPDFTSASELALNGSAVPSDGTLQLTTAAGKTGVLERRARIPGRVVRHVVHGFECAPYGFAFVLQRAAAGTTRWAGRSRSRLRRADAECRCGLRPGAIGSQVYEDGD